MVIFAIIKYIQGCCEPPNYIVIVSITNKPTLSWPRPGSNRRPSVCKTDVITIYTTRPCKHIKNYELMTKRDLLKLIVATQWSSFP